MPIVGAFAYDASGRLESTGDWDIRHDTYGRTLTRAC